MTVEPLVPGQPPLHVGVLGGGVDPELTLLAASSGTNTVHILGCARKPIRARFANPASTVEERASKLNFDSSPARRISAAATDTHHCPKITP